MIHIEKHVTKDPNRDMTATVIHTVSVTYEAGSFNSRAGHLWRPDNRYPGDWMIRRHESGGAEITFTGSQHNSKEIKKIIPEREIDRVILSLLEVRR